MENNIAAVDEILFKTLEAVSKGEMKLDKAKAINDLSSTIFKSASLQLQKHKLTKGFSKTPLFTDSKEETPKLPEKTTPKLPIKPMDIHSQKNAFAVSLGYKDMMDALKHENSFEFNSKFKKSIAV